MNTNYDRAITFWHAYNIKQLDEVERQGYIVCGTGTFQPKTKLMRHIKHGVIAITRRIGIKFGDFRHETDGGHTYGTLIIANLLNELFPELLPDHIYKPVVRGLIYHEIDELEGGDELDDGRQNIDLKAIEAALAMQQHLSQLPNIQEMVAIHYRAELSKGIPYLSIDHANYLEVAAWWIKAIDKTESILQNGRYSKKGIVGHISQKSNPSERDSDTVKILGTNDITFVWAEPARTWLKDSILWDIILAMIDDVYADVPQEIPAQFSPGSR